MGDGFEVEIAFLGGASGGAIIMQRPFPFFGASIMTRQHGQHVAHAIAVDFLDAGGNTAVQITAAGIQNAFVGHVAGQRVLE